MELEHARKTSPAQAAYLELMEGRELLLASTQGYHQFNNATKDPATPNILARPVSEDDVFEIHDFGDQRFIDTRANGSERWEPVCETFDNIPGWARKVVLDVLSSDQE